MRQRERNEDEDFGERDPRRFNFVRTWTYGSADVVSALDAGNWDSIEFRHFICQWNNADGLGNNLFELVGTADLVRQFDPTQQ